jgi:Amidohydrolase family/WD40-like Beta Propeller Repeat
VTDIAVATTSPVAADPRYQGGLPARALVLLLLCTCIAPLAIAQVSVDRGTNMSVDVSSDGRLAIDLLGDVWIVPGGGGEARQLTQNLQSIRRPRWSSDGSRIVYSAVSGDHQGIWIYDLGSGESRKISAESSLDLYPSWHPDGQRILYSSTAHDSGIDLWEIDLPTGLRWRISDRPGDETEAAWSADGEDLVYVHFQNGTWSLILRERSEPEEVLVRSSEKIAAPSFRPDGSLITYLQEGVTGTAINMVILSRPRLVRTYATDEQFALAPVSWLDRNRMFYSADGQIRQRLFDSWTSSPLNFRATIQPVVEPSVNRVRPTFEWLDEPTGSLAIHAFRLFDGLGDGYQYDKDILIERGRIKAVEDHRDRPGSIVVDLGDLTILPGLIDADARLPGSFGPSHGPDLLTMGITTIVARHADGARLNALWSGKETPGPRLLDAALWQTGQMPAPDRDITAAVVTSRSTGLPTGESLPNEFRAMQMAGLTPQQILRGKGVNAAGALLADPYIGRIATGAAADLIFVDGDPLTSVRDALNVVAVVRNGRFYSISGLIDRAKSAESVE